MLTEYLSLLDEYYETIFRKDWHLDERYRQVVKRCGELHGKLSPSDQHQIFLYQWKKYSEKIK